MKIKVYISVPRGNTDWGTDHHDRMLIIRDQLKGVLNHKTARIEVINNGPDFFEIFDGFIKDAWGIQNADFVVFADGWEGNKRCKVEHELVTEYGIPYCHEDDMLRYLVNFIRHQVLALPWN